MQLPPSERGAMAAAWVALAVELYKYSIGPRGRSRQRQRSGLLSRHATDKQQKNAILNEAGVIVTLRAIEQGVKGDMEKVIEEQTADRRPDEVRDDVTSAPFGCDAKGGRAAWMHS